MDTFLDFFKSNFNVDLVIAYANLRSSIETGQILNDPDMLLAITLFAVAGLVLFACVLTLILRGPKEHSFDNQAIFTIESRIQALEMAMNDQRNLILTLKNQNKADIGYFKQEIKNMNRVLEDRDYDQKEAANRHLRAVNE